MSTFPASCGINGRIETPQRSGSCLTSPGNRLRSIRGKRRQAMGIERRNFQSTAGSGPKREFSSPMRLRGSGHELFHRDPFPVGCGFLPYRGAAFPPNCGKCLFWQLSLWTKSAQERVREFRSALIHPIAAAGWKNIRSWVERSPKLAGNRPAADRKVHSAVDWDEVRSGLENIPQ